MFFKALSTEGAPGAARLGRAALIAGICGGCANDGKSDSTASTGGSEGFEALFPACTRYIDSVSSTDLEVCAQELAPACDALSTQEECDGFMRLDGTFAPAGVIILCSWTDHHLVASPEDTACRGTVSSRCLPSRWPGEGGPSCGDREWDNYRELGDGQVAVADVACGILPMDYMSCFAAERHTACDCPHPSP